VSGRSPYPLLRPHYKRHSREEDERLAEELFYGTTVRDQKTGRDCHQYPPKNSPHERQAFDALQRLLISSDLPPGVLGGLLCALDLDGSFGRRLVFKPRKRKRSADSPTDLQITLHVGRLHRAGWKIDAAVADAEKKFGRSRKTVYAAMKRIKRESPWLEV
jgi:hypothetical protein